MSAQQPVSPRTYEFMVFAEHFQFYVRDSSAESHPPAYWEDEDKDQLIYIGDKVIGVGTARELDVPVAVELLADEPKDEDLADWDHIVQCSLDVPSGVLVVEGPSEGHYPSERIEVPPGIYAMRIYYGMLDEVDLDGFEGDDFYRIVVWKTDEVPEFAVLKQWMPRRIDV